MVWLTWREATERALYGAGGFYRRAEIPARHFRTSVHVSQRYAAALARLLAEVDEALDRPAELDVVDVGAGRAELLTQLRELVPARLATRIRPVAVEVTSRPADLDPYVSWRRDLPDEITGLVVANEWLDNVPVDVVERYADGLRVVLVDPSTGAERAGDAPCAVERSWLARWWPLDHVGDRAEVGWFRDEAWAQVVRRMRRGVAVAADYAHWCGSRPPYGTVAGYREGRSVPAIPDGSCDITAHVALDACAGAGSHAGATETLLTSQRKALRTLGLRGQRPAMALAQTDPAMYVRELQRAGEEGELLDPAGLGGFGWLVQAVGTPLPASMTA